MGTEDDPVISTETAQAGSAAEDVPEGCATYPDLFIANRCGKQAFVDVLEGEDLHRVSTFL